jgi:hypothetical protein
VTIMIELDAAVLAEAFENHDAYAAASDIVENLCAREAIEFAHGAFAGLSHEASAPLGKLLDKTWTPETIAPLLEGLFSTCPAALLETADQLIAGAREARLAAVARAEGME